MDDNESEIDRLHRELTHARDRVAALEASESRYTELLDRLRESETRYRQLVENVNSIILRMDSRGTITFINRFACSFFGYPEDELLGRNVVGTIVPEVDGVGQDLAEEIHNICEHPERYQNHENENMHRDGGRVWVAWTNKPLYDENGVLSEVLCIGNDLTGRKHFEEALQASERNYREIFNSTMNAIFVHEIPSGRILDVNQAALDMFGCSREDVFQMSFWRKVADSPRQGPASAVRFLRKAVAQGQQVARWPVRRKNGQRLWVEVKVHQAVIGGVPRVLAMLADITERKSWEEALKSSERNYREIFDATMNAIFVHEIPTGRIIDVNQTMLDMFGMSREEALRCTVEEISEGVPPYTREEAAELLRKAAFEGPQKFEWRSRRKTGEAFWTEVTLQQAVIGGIPRVLAVANDINKRKHYQERLLEEQQTLHQLLESQERERRLIAFEIHDGLAQHLTAASMYCGNFERLCHDNLEEALQSHKTGAAMLQKALAEARRLIRGLRPPILDESGLVAAIEHLVVDMKESSEVGIEFSSKVRFDRLDPAWENSLFRIVQESLTNALRYSESEKIEVRLREEADLLILEIEDWGNGFDAKCVARQCFGLKGIRERAALLGGTATIDSSPGEGTRIRVELPLDADAATPASGSD